MKTVFAFLNGIGGVVKKPVTKLQLRRAINRAIRAEIELSWIGSKEPGDHAGIEAEFTSATLNLKWLIDDLFEERNPT